METTKQTILIVDDMPTNIEILSKTLGSTYEVLFATNGPDALSIAFDQNPDLVLLDVMMPEMDGYEVCRQLQQDARTRRIPIIFVTALDQEDEETKGLGLGAIDYITKPIRPPIVQARVRNHLELKRYRDFLENLSATDGLTGIANRRRLDECLAIEWRRARRNQTPLSLILLDIDLFKTFNDHYGHLAGDDCLRQLARTLSQCIRRPSDLLARYGGEEFACLMPDTDPEGALLVAQQMWTSFSNLNIPHAYSPVADRVTLSLGVATMIPLIGQPLFDLIRRADECLYSAKHNGRNQIKCGLEEIV
jgi:diguanylate cyclase (GGDEF)-like protein